MAQSIPGAFIDRSRGVDTTDVDWAYVARAGLTDDEAVCLGYMARVEANALAYLPDVLSRHAAQDRELLGFVVCWAYEELQHGRAIERFLRVAGRTFEASPRRERTFEERVESLGTRLLGFATPHFVAAHMAWGAASEMTAALAYSRLAAHSQNRELKKLLGRLAKDERRHQSFYYRQARDRLAASRLARILTRYVMLRWWGPVGDGVAEPAAFGFIGALLFDDDAGRTALSGVDAAIARLPGLGGFDRASLVVAQSIADVRRRAPRSMPPRAVTLT